jgi:type VI secretion system protein ImpC
VTTTLRVLILASPGEEADAGASLLAACAAGSSGHPRVVLETLSAGREDFLDVFYEQVFTAEHAGTPEIPLSAVVLGYEFDRGTDDAESLRHLARMGESLRVPFLAAVSPAFWGIRQPALLANLPDVARKVEGSEYAKWNLLRREEASLWLCLAANRLALRDPKDGSRSLWASGSYALGALLIRSFLAGGARFPMRGLELADLPVPPVEVYLPDQKALEISRAGLAPLVARKGEAAASFPSLPVLHLPKRYDREEATRSAAAVATLPYQAFAGAAAHALDGLVKAMSPGMEPEAIQQHLGDGLRAFLVANGEEPPPAAPEAPEATEPIQAVEVETHPDPENPAVWQIIVRLRPLFQISGAAVDLVLGQVVPR